MNALDSAAVRNFFVFAAYTLDYVLASVAAAVQDELMLDRPEIAQSIIQMLCRRLRSMFQ
jgi:hypothetical protein